MTDQGAGDLTIPVERNYAALQMVAAAACNAGLTAGLAVPNEDCIEPAATGLRDRVIAGEFYYLYLLAVQYMAKKGTNSLSPAEQEAVHREWLDTAKSVTGKLPGVTIQ